MKIKKAVHVHVINVVRQMEKEEKSELTVPGVFYHDKDNYYLHYEEKQAAGLIKTVIKFSTDELLLLRSGAVNMRLHFFKDKRRSSASIDSGAGKFTFESELVSYKEDFSLNHDLINKVAFQYDLLSVGEYIGSYDVVIKIEEEQG